MRLSDVSEFQLIERISSPFLQGLEPGTTGIGDDCSVVPISDATSLLVTTDMLVQDVHFLLDKIPPEDLGYKSVAVSLSDIAGMGGTPGSAYIAIALPPALDVGWLERFYKGVQELCEESATRVLGGDTVRSSGPLVITSTVVGLARSATIKYRSGARAGDTIAVSGLIGDSAGGLRALLEGRPSSPVTDALVAAHHRPRPHLKQGEWLASLSDIHAMMDLSDGLDSDVRRIMTASNCGVRISVEKIPISEPLFKAAAEFSWNARALAAGGGEDYCLLLTADSAAFPALSKRFEETFSCPLTGIGKVTDEPGRIIYEEGGSPAHLDLKGFRHFG